MSEPLSIKCPSCGSTLKLKDYSLIGKKVPCPKCKEVFQVKLNVDALLNESPDLAAEEEDLLEEPRETRLWKCPWCGKESQVPTDEPDPSSCDDCRASAPPKKLMPPPRFNSRKPSSLYSKHPALCIASIIFGLLFFACCLLPDPGNRSRSTSPSTGDRVVITTKMWLSVDESAYEESQKLVPSRDELGLELMEAQGRIFVVPAGTTALLLEPGLFTSRVRIQSGKHAGKAGYISSEFVDKQ